MSTEQYKTTIRRFFAEGLNQHHLALVDELVSPAIIGHSPLLTTHGIAEYRQFLAGYLTAFPDSQFALQEVLAEGDTSMAHWTTSGTNLGPLAGLPPTGKRATTVGVRIDHWVNGQVQESWIFFDNLTLMQQLGIIPTPD